MNNLQDNIFEYYLRNIINFYYYFFDIFFHNIYNDVKSKAWRRKNNKSFLKKKRNLFRQRKETKEIKDRILRD